MENTREESQRLDSEQENVERKSELDWDKVIEDFGEYLDEPPKNRYSTKYRKWLTITMHALMTAATGGTWIALFTLYVMGRFFSRINWEDYKEEYLVKKEVEREPVQE